MRTVKYVTANELVDGDKIQMSAAQCAGQRLDARHAETVYEVLGIHAVEQTLPGGTGTTTNVRFFGFIEGHSIVVTVTPSEEFIAAALVPRAEKKSKK